MILGGYLRISGVLFFEECPNAQCAMHIHPVTYQ